MRLSSWRPAIITALVVAASVVLITVATNGSGPVNTPNSAGGVSGASGTYAAVVPGTVVHLVAPLDRAGRVRAGYTVASAGRGHCWTSSFVNGRLYRCFQTDNILDPCWKQAGRHAVVCLPKPWSHQLVRLRLTRQLPVTSTFGPSLWGLRLGDGVGANCLVSMGASGAVGQRPISYLCPHGWVLVGAKPDQSHKTWTMLTARWVDHRYRLRGSKPLPAAWKAVLH